MVKSPAVRLFAEQQCCGDCALMLHWRPSLSSCAKLHPGNGLNFRSFPCPMERHLALHSRSPATRVRSTGRRKRKHCESDACRTHVLAQTWLSNGCPTKAVV